MNQHILWPKDDIKNMAQENFIKTFKEWQKFGLRSEKSLNDKNLLNTKIVYYDENPAENGCRQVAITCLAHLPAFAQPKHDGIQNFNYEDRRSNYDHDCCFTIDRDYNYTCKAPLNRILHTKSTFETLKHCNPTLLEDWPDSYLEMVEDVMCASRRMYQLMLQYLGGEETVHPPKKFYEYKNRRAVDAKNNWEAYKQNLHSDSQLSEEPMDDEESNGTQDSQNQPLMCDNNSSSSDLLPQGMADLIAKPSTEDASASSDLVNNRNEIPAQDDTNYMDIGLPESGAFREEYDKLLNSNAVAAKTQKDSDLEGAHVSDGMLMTKYDAEVAQAYYEKLGPVLGKQFLTVGLTIHNDVMKNRLRKDMSKIVPCIVKDPEGLKSILDDNPEFMVQTLNTLADDWDSFWPKMKPIDKHLFNKLRVKFVAEHVQAKRQHQSSVSHAMPENSPQGANSTIAPRDSGQAAEQSNDL